MPAKTEKPGRRVTTRERNTKSDSYTCDSCGLVVSVDEECGCMEAHEIICCGEPMRKTRAPRARSTKK